jgi:hypothetical protein
MSLNYLKTVFLLASLILSVTVILNWLIDPAGIYHTQRVSPERYAEELVGSQNGLLWPEGMFSERELAKALTKYAGQYDCVVIGSSHAMQISSFRNTKSLTTECTELINISASGASLEDHFVLAYLSTQAGAKSIVLGVDPWTLTPVRDFRWLIYYRDLYEKARIAVFGADTGIEGTPDQPSKLTNLLNIEYTKRSFLMLKRLLVKGALKITHADKTREEVGGEDPIKLPDGSHIYSSGFISQVKNSTISVGGNPYLTDKIVSTERGVREYRELLMWLLKHNITPVLLMTPYHHNVWKSPESPWEDLNNPNVLAMTKTEKIVLKLGKELGVRVVGSYRPKMFGCQVDEFYDFMHPKAACLSRMKAQSTDHRGQSDLELRSP